MTLELQPVQKAVEINNVWGDTKAGDLYNTLVTRTLPKGERHLTRIDISTRHGLVTERLDGCKDFGRRPGLTPKESADIGLMELSAGVGEKKRCGFVCHQKLLVRFKDSIKLARFHDSSR